MSRRISFNMRTLPPQPFRELAHCRSRPGRYTRADCTLRKFIWPDRYGVFLLACAQGEGVYLEDVCFNAQQAVEKAIKAAVIQCAVEFPYVHAIAQLLTLAGAMAVATPPLRRPQP
jgi:hypothetical protein